MFSSGTSEIDRMLRFRDWLRANEGEREKYAQVKRGLAKSKWHHVHHYADAKTSIIQEILERAQFNILQQIILWSTIITRVDYTVHRLSDG